MYSCRSAGWRGWSPSSSGAPAVKLLAPLNYHQTLSHPFGPENSAAAWFRARQEDERSSPLRQFYAYSGGLSIEEFDELMCSAHAGEPACAEAARPTSSGRAVRCWMRTSSQRPAAIADPRFAGYGSEDVDLCWRIGAQGGQVTRTAAVYVHHFHNSSLIDNAVNAEVALRTANRILYAKWGPKLHRAGADGNAPRRLAAGISQRPFHLSAVAPRHTSFIADLRAATGRDDIPDQVIWQPTGL